VNPRSPKDTADGDPTGEKEGPKVDAGQRDDGYEISVVSAGENSSGRIDRDDRGQARWKWITEEGAATASYEGTFDHLRALTNDALSIEADPEEAKEPEPVRVVGYNPYDTGPKKARPK